jgi:hypothetical protein
MFATWVRRCAAMVVVAGGVFAGTGVAHAAAPQHTVAPAVPAHSATAALPFDWWW